MKSPDGEKTGFVEATCENYEILVDDKRPERPEVRVLRGVMTPRMDLRGMMPLRLVLKRGKK